jgi:predicted transglutaminase-like cysteine proteinase
MQFCGDAPEECKVPEASGRPASLNADTWRQLNTVNRYFNAAIKPMTDEEQYGVIEKWTYATSGKGDCEDYVLEKKRKLLQLGWAPASLLITVVIDKQGGGHAVLTVVTDKGDYVLDNVTDEILLWSDSGLTFVKRQFGSNSNVWVDLGRRIGSPAFVATAIGR